MTALRPGLRWKYSVLLAVGLVAGLVAALVTGGLFLRSRPAPRLTEKDTVVLADFTNQTGDTVFDETLRQGLAVQLEQSPFLAIIPERRIQQTLRLMGQPPDARLSPEIARELCQRAEGTGELEGSIVRLGTEYVLGLKAVTCRTGEVLAREQVRSDDRSHVLAALGKAARSIRVQLGESLKTVQKFDTPLEQATTASLEALHAYSLGLKTKDINGDKAAVPLFEGAILLDPNFAMAYALLGTSYSNLGERNRGSEMTTKAYELRDRVSERERFYIDSYYHDLVTGDLDKAIPVYELWAKIYPRDDKPTGNLGLIYGYLGQHEKAVAQAREALRLQPGSGLRYANLAQSYVHVERLNEARSTVEEARAKKLDSPYLCFYSYQLAFLQNDVAAMAKEVGWASGKPGVEDILLAAEADTAGYYGQVDKARELSHQAIISAQQVEESETAASYETAAALREAVYRDSAEARRHAAAALALSTGRDVQFGSVLALAFAGEVAQAQKLSGHLSKDFSEDTLVKFHYLPTINAELAVSRHDSAKAIELLKIATPFELGVPGDASFLPSLYPVYVRGEAYLAAHQGSEAAAEFEKILKWRGVVLNEPIAPLAHLGLARAYVLQGDTTRARVAYHDFFDLWKDADPDVPILKQAKAEYAKLQ